MNITMLMQLLPMVVVFVVFYLFLIIPEKKRRKKYEGMLNDLSVNDEVLTRGGIMGKVINIQDDYIILESGPDRARFKISKQGISSVVARKED